MMSLARRAGHNPNNGGRRHAQELEGHLPDSGHPRDVGAGAARHGFRPRSEVRGAVFGVLHAGGAGGAVPALAHAGSGAEGGTPEGQQTRR